MELFIVYRAVHCLLTERGIEPVSPRIGEYLTVQEMAGFQMFVAKMDDELIRLWNAALRHALFDGPLTYSPAPCPI